MDLTFYHPNFFDRPRRRQSNSGLSFDSPSMIHPSVASVTLIAIVLCLGVSPSPADEFDTFVEPLLRDHCVRCHGGDETNGDIELTATADAFANNPLLIKEVIDVIDANDMPPEDQPQLSAHQRTKLLSTLRTLLRQSATQAQQVRIPIRRLNRFQYNNAVRDLFDLNRDVFSLPEKLMTRHSNYLQSTKTQMPDKVTVASHALDPALGLREVSPFPKDLRATHGFDNQANQLTLSPLLLDAFLRLSVSIVQSPDFNANTVGNWQDLFAEPAPDVELRAEVSKRLRPFLTQAFRRTIDDVTLNRYVDYVLIKIDQQTPFTTAMKKATSAALSSPLFLYRTGTTLDDRDEQFQLASNLSFFLWASGPDLELLQLAATGQLAQSAVLRATIDRMIADPKIERFLDSFPAQWLQLENVLAATPDPQLQRYFSLDKKQPASLQMLLEPLLLFDAVFIENRPISDLISPKFAYQSQFLRTWYTAKLKPPAVDVEKIAATNRDNDQQRQRLQSLIDTTRDELNAIVQPVRERILAKRAMDGERTPVDLKPFAAWEFDGDLTSSVNSLDLTAHGDIRFQDGSVVLKRSYLQSPPLEIDLKAKSLEVWCRVQDLNQRGGGVMGIQGPGDFFDTIVLGERQPKHWISGSNGFSRTKDFPDSFPETAGDELLHLVMVYRPDGTTLLYRNGVPYGQPFNKGSATFPKGRTSVLFGLRHLPAGGNRYLSTTIDKARLYDRALTANEVAASCGQLRQCRDRSGTNGSVIARATGHTRPIDLET